jgi:hypothetical protein
VYYKTKTIYNKQKETNKRKMKITEFRKLIREEVRKVIKEAVSEPIGLPYDDGKMAAQIIAAATQLGMTQGPYMFGKPSGDYSFDFDQMDGDDGEKVVVKGGKGVGNKNGNNPSAVFILNPKMQSNPTIQALTKKAKSKYNEVRKVVNEGTPKYKVGQTVSDLNGDEPFKIVKIYPNKAAAMMDMKKTISPKLYKDLADEVEEMYDNYRPISSKQDGQPWYVIKPISGAGVKGYPPFLNPEVYIGSWEG